jgi:3',5'-cyclic-AMP phosphodiesterase
VNQFGQYPEPDHVVVHISDTHLLYSHLLYGEIDSTRLLVGLMERLVSSGLPIEALVFTGDLADRAEPGAYVRLRETIEPFSKRLGAEVIWVMGNHDERQSFSEVLLEKPAPTETLDSVHMLGGLRLIVLDSSVPGFHHGELTPAQLEWLAAQLETPAEHGTLLALHHPPIPTPIALMGIIELENQESLAEVIRGTDVRGVLGGHLHYTTFSTFAGIPVSVAAASCYNIDLVANDSKLLSAVSAGVGASLVYVYPEQVVFSSIFVDDGREYTHFDAGYLDRIRAMTLAQRKAMFSDKSSDFNQGAEKNQSGF